ncbi:MAG: peptide-methionine (S)-S-oxide reductase MsrA [Reinekea forsetii]|uniref:peptide-methionine (S)-S-oxide reductase MsrA n=1 Tax=Reinekea sp. TaxID=1970455 RepID=UPI00257A8BFD|nr:peptide-methionine (S)-S-oxide reductase MsrA [Reinekea sp.]MDO7674684.1 peptide-methionine (S)-S-oxide reductase MsrA [Reinekea forsetii]
MSNNSSLPSVAQSLPGRAQAMELDFQHAVLAIDMRQVPDNCASVWLALGCFWGAERLFWALPGVKNTAVGYAGGHTPNPTYDEVCSGQTGHTEIVQVVFDPNEIGLTTLLKVFWEAHNPTQGMRQGNDVGTQYRSAIYGSADQLVVAQASLDAFQQQLTLNSLGQISTELRATPTFYYAETYHQQYLHKNPRGYCGLKGTGVVCAL